MKTEALDAAFSLLPRHSADYAARRVMERARQPIDLDAFEIRWAEFDLAGRFQRGGISDISDLATTLVANSQADPGISLLARRASADPPSAGHMEWGESHDQILWYLPFRFFGEDGKAGIRLRGLLVTSHLFGEVLELFNGDANLTMAEKRALFQLVGGLELRAAAKEDGVSYETKRAHIKSASEKLGCAGQKDLLRKAVGQMAHLMSINDSELKQTEPAISLAENYLHDDMQLVIRNHRSGPMLRYLVGGPSDGRPVMMVHGMMFPVILRGISRFLHRNNIRLYVPIRTGYLEGRALGTLFDQGDMIEQSLREIACVAEEEGLTGVPLLGSSLGGAIAVKLALKYPGLFSQVILMSLNLARPQPGDAGQKDSFYEGIQNLKSNALLFKLISLEYRKFYSDAETCRHILKSHFSECKIDLDVLDGSYCGHPAYRMFAATYRSSIMGTAEDFRQVMLGMSGDAGNLDVPLSIVHGENDPLTSFSEIKQTFRAPKQGLERLVKGAGHFAPASHGDAVWQAVGEACSVH